MVHGCEGNGQGTPGELEGTWGAPMHNYSITPLGYLYNSYLILDVLKPNISA